jgi:hypothetical protein
MSAERALGATGRIGGTVRALGKGNPDMSKLFNASMRVRWAAIGAAIAVTLGGGALGVVHATSSSGERAVFVPITPCRLFDTRSGADDVGARNTPIAGGESFTQQVRGTNGNCAVPADAVAVAMNVTTINGTAGSFLTIWPADASKPLASSLNWIPGAPPTPNKVDVKLSATGAISLFNNSGSVDVLADVVGYYVDHNHDDRYYTKAEVYAKAEVYSRTELDSRTVRMSVNPRNMRGPSSDTVFATINGCVKVGSGQDYGELPLDLPVGARLLNVDIGFFDGETSAVYTARLWEGAAVTYGLDEQSLAYTDGGAGSGGFGLVKHHLTPNTPTAVDEGDVFKIGFTGIANNTNGVCYVTIEYDPAP